jgi:hypothetical protein
MTEHVLTQSKPQQVFISYAAADKNIARIIAETLQSAGLKVWIDEWELAVGDSIQKRIHEAVTSSDILLVLLSPASVASRWIQTELNAALSLELRDRAITVIPALIEECEIPPLLADRAFIDLRGDMQSSLLRLVNQIGAAPYLNFSMLTSKSFENLIADLLVTLGFSVQRISLTRDKGCDLIANYRSRDPFGAEHVDTWLVEIKLYRDQRVSVTSLREMLGVVMLSGGKNGLIITNGRLTSVARSFLSDSTDKTGFKLRVVDGTELTNLLIQHQELIRKYFPMGDGHE